MIDMTAFDVAWSVVKMPLVPGSIRYLGNKIPPRGVFEAENTGDLSHQTSGDDLNMNPWTRHPHRYTADFLDPASGSVIIPMHGNYYPPVGSDEAFIRVGMEDYAGNLASIPFLRPSHSSATASPYFAGVEGIRDKWRGHIDVHPTRRGKGTAIYDMIAAILEHRSPHGAVLLPNIGPRSSAAEALWRGKEEGWPVVQRIDDRISIPHRLSTD